MADMQHLIEQLVREQLAPAHLELINESHMHAVPANSQTHFKLVVVSDAFADLRAVKRHQLVYGVLAQPLASGVHALSLALFTPAEWQEDASVAPSPPCAGKRMS